MVVAPEGGSGAEYGLLIARGTAWGRRNEGACVPFLGAMAKLVAEASVPVLPRSMKSVMKWREGSLRVYLAFGEGDKWLGSIGALDVVAVME